MLGRLQVDGGLASNALISISTVVLGELLVGIYQGDQPERENAKVALLQSRCTILPVTDLTADHFARNKAFLRRSGRPIPTNDIWIAATALEHDLILITENAHFKQVPNLRLR